MFGPISDLYMAIENTTGVTMTLLRTTLAACLLSFIAMPAFSLDFSEAPRKISGVTPGMSLEDAKNNMLERGLVQIPGTGTRTGSSIDLLNEANELIGSVFTYGDIVTKDMVYIETGATGSDLENSVFRVTGIFDPNTTTEEELENVSLGFGELGCGNGIFSYDSEWKPIRPEHCDIQILQPATAMTKDIAAIAATSEVAVHNAMLGSMPDSQLIMSIQNNKLASRLTIAEPEASVDNDQSEIDEGQSAEIADNVAESIETIDAISPEQSQGVNPQSAQSMTTIANRGVEILNVSPGMDILEARDTLISQGFELTPWGAYKWPGDIDEIGAQFQKINVPYIAGGRDKISLKGSKTLFMRKLEGENYGEFVNLNAFDDNQVYMVVYNRSFPEGGPYPKYEDTMAKIYDRMNGATQSPSNDGKVYTGRRTWFMSQDGTVLSERPENTYWWQSYTDPSDIWEQVHKSKGTLEGRDFMMFHAVIEPLKGDDSHLINSIRLVSLNLDLLVPKYKAAYQQILDMSELEDRGDIEF
jgi:hypothetical protein